MYGSRPSDYEANCRWGGGQSDDEDDGGGGSPSTMFSPMSHVYGNAPPTEEYYNGSASGPARYTVNSSSS